MELTNTLTRNVNFITVERVTETGTETVKLTRESHPTYFSGLDFCVGDDINFEGFRNVVNKIIKQDGKIFVVAYL